MRSSRKAHSLPRVDLTPLLDTIFLVVVLLLCAFVHMRLVRAIGVERPIVPSGAAIFSDRKVLQIAVSRDGRIIFEGDEIGLQKLSDELAQRTAGAEGCLISADRHAEHGVVTDVLVAAKQALRDKPAYFEVRAAPGE